MANQTSRFGLNTFGGEVAGSLLDDAGKYTGVDRQLIDILLAAIEHHNHHVSAADADGPSDAPLTTIGTSGSLSAGLDYSYCVSFVDADGLETPAGDESTVGTPDILVAPDAPSGDTDTGGGLADGAYDYGITGVRGDEQSPLSDLFTVTLLDDEGTVNLTLPSLGGADSFNVWRRKDTEGGFTLIENTVLSSVVDLGAVSAYPFPTDPTYAPPSENQGIDQYSFTITLSAADQALVQGYASWRLYRTTTAGIYSAQSLVAEVTDRVVELDPESDLVVEWVDFGDALITGQPTTVDQRMHFEPFVFEEVVSLGAASGDYPLNYPLVFDGSLYLNNGPGSWVQIGGASGGGGGSGLGAFLGIWDSDYSISPEYLPGDVVTYNNAIWQAVASQSTTPPSGGVSPELTGSISASVDYYLAVATEYAQPFELDANATIDAIALFSEALDVDPITVELTDDTGATSYATGTLADPTSVAPGWTTIALDVPVDLVTGTTYRIEVTGAGVSPNVSTCDGPTLDGLTVPGPVLSGVSWGTSNTGKYLAARLYSPGVARWTNIGYLVPSGGTTGQVLTKISNDDGDYGWVTP